MLLNVNMHRVRCSSCVPRSASILPPGVAAQSGYHQIRVVLILDTGSIMRVFVLDGEPEW
jgi:hypothetical protein